LSGSSKHSCPLRHETISFWTNILIDPSTIARRRIFGCNISQCVSANWHIGFAPMGEGVWSLGVDSIAPIARYHLPGFTAFLSRFRSAVRPSQAFPGLSWSSAVRRSPARLEDRNLGNGRIRCDFVRETDSGATLSTGGRSRDGATV
jgi:hypothetical protein